MPHELREVSRNSGSAYLAALVVTGGAVGALAAGNGPLEYLDEETGTTVTAVGQPLLFACARPEFANARDYVTLVAAAVNRSGTITYVMIGYFWSMVDPRLRGSEPTAVQQLRLQADERSMELPLQGRSAHDLGIGVPVHRPPLGTGTPYVYDIDLPSMRFIAASHHLELHIESNGTLLTYKLFEDRRVALREFVRRVSSED
jgi:hypothetical protein